MKFNNNKLLENYFKYLKNSDHSETTILTYLSIIKSFIKWNEKENKNKLFTNLKRTDFLDYFGFLRYNKNLSNKRMGLVRSTLSSFSIFIETFYEEKFPYYKNIVGKLYIGDVTTTKKEKLIHSDNEINFMLNKLIYLKKYRLACYLALLCSSGMRKSEVAQMKVVYFSDKHLVFNNKFYETDYIRTKGRGKRGKIIKRYILKSSFDKYLYLWLEERKKLNINCEYLFVTNYKKEYFSKASIKTFDSYAKSISSIFQINFYSHSCRHYFTTRLQRNGIPQSIIKDLMQWDSLDMINLYSDISGKDRINDYIRNNHNLF